MVLMANINTDLANLDVGFASLGVDTNEMSDFSELKKLVKDINHNSYSADDLHCKKILLINVIVESLNQKLKILNEIAESFEDVDNDYRIVGITLKDKPVFEEVSDKINLLKKLIIEPRFNILVSDLVKEIKTYLNDLKDRVNKLSDYLSQISEIKNKYHNADISPESIPPYKELITYTEFYKTYITNKMSTLDESYLQSLTILMDKKIASLENRFSIYNTYRSNLFQLFEKCKEHGIDINSTEEAGILTLYLNSLKTIIKNTGEKDQIQDIMRLFSTNNFQKEEKKPTI